MKSFFFIGLVARGDFYPPAQPGLREQNRHVQPEFQGNSPLISPDKGKSEVFLTAPREKSGLNRPKSGPLPLPLRSLSRAWRSKSSFREQE
jgi:hypothetical protein